MTSQSSVPTTFQRALDALRRALDGDPGRPELVIEDMPAPQRLAPYSAAISATVSRGDIDVAVGRLIVLYDPEGRSNPGKVFPTPRLCGERPGPRRVHPAEQAGLAEVF